MNRVSRLAEIPAGSWTKWVVVGFWVVVLVIMLPLSSKLTGAEKNDAKYWLPGNAESTKVLDVQSRFQSPNIYTGVVVYVRASGITAADRAKAAADARRFAGVPGVVPGQIVGPIVSADGKAIETILQVNLGSKGYADANKAVDAIRAITSSNANGLVSHITGPLGERGRQQQCVQEHQRHAAVLGRGGRHRDLADHLPEPGAVAAAGDLLRGGADHRPGGDLPAGGACWPDGQRAERRHLGGAGLRREHRLRAADRRPVPGGTAPSRPPSPGDGRGAAARRPAIIASAATVILALLTLSAADLNSTKSLGPVLAIGVAVGMFVMITLLPALLVTFPRGVFWPYRPSLRLGRADPPGDVGAGRLAHRPPAADRPGSPPP